MCGIAGMTAVFPGGQLPADSSVYVRSMTDTMRYRGPDGDGLWSSDGVCLGHRRLSIIDLAGGGQPMHDAHGTLTITFNGEIYNFREIRSQLEAEGAHFLSHSDTEVILEAYRHWGTSCVDRFNGMFAFALWDGEKNVFSVPATVSVKSLFLHGSERHLRLCLRDVLSAANPLAQAHAGSACRHALSGLPVRTLP